MSLFLLIFGAATAATGLILAVAGVILPAGTLSTEVVTPGAIVAVGGLMLVGLGLVVRQLQHIERALVTWPAARPARPSEEPSFPSTKSAGPTARSPFPPKPLQANAGPPPLPPAALATSAPADVPAVETPPPRIPSVTPLESAPVVDEPDISLMPPAPVHAGENIREVRDRAVNGRGANGATPLRPVPRVVAKPRHAGASDIARDAAFNEFWPAKSRGGLQAASAQVAAPAPQPPPLPAPQLAVAPSHDDEVIPAVMASVPAEPPEVVPISILKSGVVEGMAYTLYSDGSIEAELPQGTLRFGSIAALRNHIESSA